MKFHSNLKTVLITLGVLLMFVFSSVFIITELDLTSPTLLVTNSLFQNLTEKDTDISFSMPDMAGHEVFDWFSFPDYSLFERF